MKFNFFYIFVDVLVFLGGGVADEKPIYLMVVFRLSPCSECSLCSFGNFPGVRSIKADVSELNVGSVVLGDQEYILL